jgi:glutaredoxin 3
MAKEQSHKSFFDDQHMGGYDDVRALEKDNKLQDLT